MFEPDEVVLLFLGLVALTFVFVNPNVPKNYPSFRLLFLAFAFELTAWVATNLESFVLPQALNITEHVCELIANVLLIIFTLKVFPRAEKAK